jgi:hypothetical protein
MIELRSERIRSEYCRAVLRRVMVVVKVVLARSQSRAKGSSPDLRMWGGVAELDKVSR